MPNDFRPNCLPTLIGSLPLDDHQEACEMVFEHVPEIPIWAQLPLFREEGMLRQFLPGMPGVVFSKEKAFIDKTGESFDAEALAFYEEYIAVTEGNKALVDSRFRLEPKTAKGFFTLLDRLKRIHRSPAAVKGQITGPVTFTTGVNDQDGRAIYYDEGLRDAAIKLLALKAQWQVRELKSAGCPVIVFFDEPALAGFGSSEFISISREDIAACLSEVIAAVQVEGGLAGVHVCANTDWSLLLDSDVDIVNFDAYAYFERFILYPEEIGRFISSGRTLAWGIVPTLHREDIENETVESLLNAWREKSGRIESLGIDRKTLMAQSLITPSCGAGSLSLASTRKVLALTKGLADRIRRDI